MFDTILNERASKIKNLVAENELDLATKLLMDFVDDFDVDRKRKRVVTVLRGKFSEWRDYKRQGDKRQDVIERANRLRNQILELRDIVIAEVLKQRNQPDSQPVAPVRTFTTGVMPEEESKPSQHPAREAAQAQETTATPSLGPPEQANPYDEIIFGNCSTAPLDILIHCVRA